MTAPELKRHEWKLPTANWLRDEINEILARYDVPSDVYSSDVAIDATCVIAVDKIAANLLPAHIGAVLEEAADLAAKGFHPRDILALRPDAITALDRAKREARVEGMRLGYRAGFDASAEGWNGEWPFEGVDPEIDERWVNARDNAIRALIAAEERGEGE